MRQTLAINTTMEATWGEARLRSLEENASTVVPALPTVGSALDDALFRHVRPIPPGAAGLVTIPLDASVLAHSRGSGFADVRVLDSAGRQVPYLVERASEPLSIDLTIEPETRGRRRCRRIAGSASIEFGCRSRVCPARASC